MPSKENEKLARLQAEKTSLMNNSKWRKLFKVVEESGCSIEEALYKPLTGNTLCRIVLELEPGQKTYTKDGCGVGCTKRIAGPTRFDEIEFIRMIFSTGQDRDRFVKALNNCGKFEYKTEQDNILTVFGYC